MRDLRDPQKLGELILGLKKHYKGEPIHLLHEMVERKFPTDTVPDYQDETTIQKYGRPQDLPSTLPN